MSGQEPGGQGGAGAVRTELMRSDLGPWRRDGEKQADQRRVAGQTGGTRRDVGDTGGGPRPILRLHPHLGGSILQDLEHRRETGLEEENELSLGLLGLRLLGSRSPHRRAGEAQTVLCVAGPQSEPS